MAKTRTQLMQDAKSGNLSLEIIKYYNRKDIPKRIQGIRKVINSNTNNLMLKQSDGSILHLDIPKASLIEYTNDTLTIFDSGYRKPNAKERQILDKWAKIKSTSKYKEDAMQDVFNDGSQTYWQEKRFFIDHNASYLMGLEEKRGMKLDFNRRNEGLEDYIKDSSIKGEPILIYKVYMNE